MGAEIPGRRSKTRLPRAIIFCPFGASGKASGQMNDWRRRKRALPAIPASRKDRGVGNQSPGSVSCAANSSALFRNVKRTSHVSAPN